MVAEIHIHHKQSDHVKSNCVVDSNKKQIFVIY